MGSDQSPDSERFETSISKKTIFLSVDSRWTSVMSSEDALVRSYVWFYCRFDVKQACGAQKFKKVTDGLLAVFVFNQLLHIMPLSDR